MFKPHNILVPIDFSEEADRALGDAFAIAQRYHSNVHLLHVIREMPRQCSVDTCIPGVEYERITGEMLDEAKKKLQKELRKAKKPGGVRISTDIKTGSAAAAIRDEQREKHIDLIVMAEHKKHGFWSRLTGGTTRQVLRSVPCETLVVK